MTTIELINKISANPEYTNIVIKDEDDRTPIQAIERLSVNYEDERCHDWKLFTEGKETLCVY